MVKSANVLVSISLIVSFIALFFAVFSFTANKRLPADAQIGEYRFAGVLNLETKEVLEINKSSTAAGWLTVPKGKWRMLFESRFDEKGNFYNAIPGVFLFVIQTLCDLRTDSKNVDVVFPIASQVNYLPDTTSFLPTRGSGSYTNIVALRTGDNIHFDIQLEQPIAFSRTTSIQILKIT